MPNTAMMGSNVGYHGHPSPESGGFPQEPPQATTISTVLEAVFDAAPSGKQKQMLGEVLYPKIHEQQPELAGKITGMLLEMDNAELLYLISDSAAFHERVDEAERAYKDYLKANNLESV